MLRAGCAGTLGWRGRRFAPRCSGGSAFSVDSCRRGVVGAPCRRIRLRGASAAPQRIRDDRGRSPGRSRRHERCGCRRRERRPHPRPDRWCAACRRRRGDGVRGLRIAAASRRPAVAPPPTRVRDSRRSRERRRRLGGGSGRREPRRIGRRDRRRAEGGSARTARCRGGVRGVREALVRRRARRLARLARLRDRRRGEGRQDRCCCGGRR